MSASATLVLVPGSFSESEMYDPVVLPLRQKGYEIYVLDPPCYPKNYKPNTGIAPPSMYDDAKFIAGQVEKLSDEGKEVVLLAHSYGGVPATESLKSLTLKERKAQGKPGGVVRIAYLTACVPRVGENLVQVIQGGAPPIEVGEDGWMSHTSPTETAKLCFNSLSPEEGAAKAAEFGKHSSVSFGDVLTHAGYKDLPVSWLFCEQDLCVVPEVQRRAIEVVEESWKGTEREGKTVDVTRVPSDHVPMYSARAETEQWIESVVVKGGRE
ncbi:hypothetical protein ACN47E_004667 [Coniothyrium glycines]